MADLVDSYSESNQDSDEEFGNYFTAWGWGQSFTVSGNYELDSCKFYLKKVGAPTGNLVARLYSHSGTYGTSSVGSALLATSDNVDVTGLGAAYGLIEFTFSGAERVNLSTGYYVIMVYSGNMGDASKYPVAGWDNSSPSHSGNMCRFKFDSTWAAYGGDDLCFYVYGIAAASGGGGSNKHLINYYY